MVGFLYRSHGNVGKCLRHQLCDETSRFVHALVFALSLQHRMRCSTVSGFVRRPCLSICLFQHRLAGLAEDCNPVIFVGQKLHELFSRPCNGSLECFDACSKESLTRATFLRLWQAALKSIRKDNNQEKCKSSRLSQMFDRVWRRLTGMGSRVKQCHVSNATWHYLAPLPMHAGQEDAVSAGPWGSVLELLLAIFTPSKWETAPGRNIRPVEADSIGILAALAVFCSSVCYEQVCPSSTQRLIRERRVQQTSAGILEADRRDMHGGGWVEHAVLRRRVA